MNLVLDSFNMDEKESKNTIWLLPDQEKQEIK